MVAGRAAAKQPCAATVRAAAHTCRMAATQALAGSPVLAVQLHPALLQCIYIQPPPLGPPVPARNVLHIRRLKVLLGSGVTGVGEVSGRTGRVQKAAVQQGAQTSRAHKAAAHGAARSQKHSPTPVPAPTFFLLACACSSAHTASCPTNSSATLEMARSPSALMRLISSSASTTRFTREVGKPKGGSGAAARAAGASPPSPPSPASPPGLDAAAAACASAVKQG